MIFLIKKDADALWQRVDDEEFNKFEDKYFDRTNLRLRHRDLLRFRHIVEKETGAYDCMVAITDKEFCEIWSYRNHINEGLKYFGYPEIMGHYIHPVDLANIHYSLVEMGRDKYIGFYDSDKPFAEKEFVEKCIKTGKIKEHLITKRKEEEYKKSLDPVIQF